MPQTVDVIEAGPGQEPVDKNGDDRESAMPQVDRVCKQFSPKVFNFKEVRL